MYVDGELDTTNSLSLMQASAHTFKIGATETPAYFLDGSIDEARISDVARSQHWILFEYRNSSTAAGQLTFGSENGETFAEETEKLRDSKPVTKVEFIDVDGNATDISDWYIEGAQFEQVKDRAVSEIQAGNFDVVLSNHDDYFSEFVSTSIFFEKQYHGAKIRISVGFIVPSGTTVWQTVGVGFIDSLEAFPSGESKITLRCRDLLGYLLDTNINNTPAAETPVADGGNVGTGSMSAVSVLPFKTVNENWTITCTTPGADATAIFSVVGSVTGAKGNATSGTEFTTGTGTGGIKFTISGGGVNWSAGDHFHFTTKQHPEWSAVNLVKILWSILTGYNYDGDTIEAWSAQVLALDSTQTTANTDLDYAAFVQAISDVDALGVFDLTGYLLRDMSALDSIQELLLLFQGSLFTNTDGKLSITIYVSNFSATPFATFLDTKKIKVLGYNRNIEEVINYCPIHYKSKLKWEFSDEQLDYQGIYVASSAASIAKYGILQYGAEPFYVRWFASSGAHVKDLADKLVSRFADPPLNIDFETGSDGITTTVGKVITITDSKYNFSSVGCEVVRTTKLLDARSLTVSIRGRRDTNLGLVWGFIGSSVDEGDGLSPQDNAYDIASAADKDFAYFSADGVPEPDYRMF
jgi:hypothetical protein